MLPLPAAGAGATGDTAMSSTQHQLIEQCATRLRGIVEALDNIHHTSPQRWSTDLDDVHSSAESLLALIKDQAPARSEASFEEWLANELEGEDGQPVPAAVCDIALARRAFNHWPKLEQPAKVGGVRFSAGVSSRLVVEAAQRLYEFESTPEQEAERIERLQAFREQCFEPLGTEFSKVLSDNLPELLSTAQAEQAEAELDFSRPLETENGEPVKWICADVIEYKSARVCVAKDTGLVYSSPYIGLKIRNVMPEQAEAERPEVVAWQYRVTAGPQTGWSLWHPGKGEEFERSYTVERRPLMTVAQHERIVEARWNRAMDLMGEHVARISEKFKAERDAALARVAELERKLRNEENAHTTTIEQRDNAEHWADQLAKAIAERFGVDIGEHSNLNCPWNEALVWMQQPPAQAQHSVPEGWRIERSAERIVVMNLNNGAGYAAARNGESGIAESVLYLLAADLLAAAPGKEVGHE